MKQEALLSQHRANRARHPTFIYFRLSLAFQITFSSDKKISVAKRVEEKSNQKTSHEKTNKIFDLSLMGLA